jgi:hypothetical protein
MAKKREKDQLQKLIEKEEQQKKKLERMGFIQMMFDFYTAPII